MRVLCSFLLVNLNNFFLKNNSFYTSCCNYKEYNNSNVQKVQPRKKFAPYLNRLKNRNKKISMDIKTELNSLNYGC